MKLFPLFPPGTFETPREFEAYPFPKAEKGKTFLVNETFVRIDGVDWVSIRAWKGRKRAINVTSGHGEMAIHTPLCQGYVMAPMNEEFRRPNRPFRVRCMNGQDLREAEEDHYYVRNILNKDETGRGMGGLLWVEYRHSTGSLGETNAATHLNAFNQAMWEKRKEYAKKNPNWDYETMMNDTYKYDPKFKLGTSNFKDHTQFKKE